MKNVLFATTALVAFAGAASAASHASGTSVSFSGEMTAGYNDVIESGLFFDADLDMEAMVDLGDNVTAKATAQLFSWDNDVASVDADITVEIAYTSDRLSASLTMGDLGDKGASEYFYADRSAMAIDVENHDDDEDARALLEFGNFGLAVGCEIEAGTGTCDDGAYNVGLGATFGSIELGVGYDNAAGTQAAVTAVSADATFGSIDLGASYASSAGENSIGLEAGATFGAIEVGAYYAMNSDATITDGFGVSADYAAGALTLGAYFDNVDDGTATATSASTYGLDVGYAVSSDLTASVGVQSGGTTVYYAGIEYTVNENISATVSYATADEISGPEFKDGISAFITASF